jgi:hypothetical protein
MERNIALMRASRVPEVVDKISGDELAFGWICDEDGSGSTEKAGDTVQSACEGVWRIHTLSSGETTGYVASLQ